ncbi:MAG: AtpZ/AtpI family protein [Desulfobacteraceae bacterium]
MALAIFIGYGIGRYLDIRFGTGPWMTIVRSHQKHRFGHQKTEKFLNPVKARE